MSSDFSRLITMDPLPASNPDDATSPTAAQRLYGRHRRADRPTVLAVLHLAERDGLEARFGTAGVAALLTQAAARLRGELQPLERIDDRGPDGLFLLLRAGSAGGLQFRLDQMSRLVTKDPLTLGEERLHVTPAIGWCVTDTRSVDALAAAAERAGQAADVAAQHRDLVPRRAGTATPPQRRRGITTPGWLRTALQVLATLVLGLLLPFLALVALGRAGLAVVPPVYLSVCAALVLTAAAIWLEDFYALDPQRPPSQPAEPYPAASAIIPAYLPNEAATIRETVRAFLAVDYPGPLQVILAYNTPHDLPVEVELRRMAAADPRFVPIRVPDSRSKAQNVNAALQVVTGRFTGIFDADHHPDRAAFRRAWHWLSHGADVVQGHCVIRNGNASWVARTVAVEFSSIYAVSHPGRTRLHGFGLFGGSNGFWRTDVLREVRMRGEMLTEDIDSSIRVLLSGRKVVTDPALISRELAPATLHALWNQRMRWAQGWFQVSRRHLAAALRSPELSLRNKLGVLFLLGWREIYPWLSLQVVPVLAYLVWRGGTGTLDWGISIFVLTSLYTLSAGPSQVLFAYRLAAPEVRRHKRWFWSYLLVSTVFYTPLKNSIARIAQLKELTGERQWVVTPRAAGARPPVAKEAV